MIVKELEKDLLRKVTVLNILDDWDKGLIPFSKLDEKLKEVYNE